MKRTVTLTAALMFAGMTTLSLANENMNAGKPAPSVENKTAASTAPAEAKPVANVEQGKQPVVTPGKSETVSSKEVTATTPKVDHSSPATTEKAGMSEKKETSSVTTTSHAKENKAAHKPMTMNGKSETVSSKEETATSQKVVQGSPAVAEKTGMSEKKETSSVTTTSHAKEMKTEQKPNEAPAAANPTK